MEFCNKQGRLLARTSLGEAKGLTLTPQCAYELDRPTPTVCFHVAQDYNRQTLIKAQDMGPTSEQTH